MIEIEKKILLQPHHIEKIEREGIFIKEHLIKDTYFDAEDFRFTKENIWLRERDGMFELKRGKKKKGDGIDRYEEITDEKKILDILGLSNLPISSALQKASIHSFCTFTTRRKKFQWNECTIDMDLADFGDLFYCVAEFEVLVSSEKEIPEAERKITVLLGKLGVSAAGKVLAKLSYYLLHKRPKHYQALVEANVI